MRIPIANGQFLEVDAVEIEGVLQRVAENSTITGNDKNTINSVLVFFLLRDSQ